MGRIRAWVLTAVIVPACLWLITGCGLTFQQRAAVERFGAATVDFADLAETEFVNTRTDVVEMNTVRIGLNDPTSDPSRLDEPFTLDRVRVRLETLDALKEYGQLLHILVASSQEEELKNASDHFVASLQKVKGVTLNKEQLGAIGSAVQEVGGMLVEYYRAKAITEVVRATHQPMREVVGLIKRDFDVSQDHWALGYLLSAKALSTQAAIVGKTVKAEDVAANVVVQEAKTLASQNLARLRALSEEVGKSADRLLKALDNLKDALESSGVTTEDIDAYVLQVKGLITTYKILRAP